MDQRRSKRLGKKAAQPGLIWYPVRYMVLPFLAVFFLTNPMAYTMGRFLPERFKPAFYDSAVSYVHPITGLFPHANPGELFVYLGIAAGITQLGLGLGDLGSEVPTGWTCSHLHPRHRDRVDHRQDDC